MRDKSIPVVESVCVIERHRGALRWGRTQLGLPAAEDVRRLLGGGRMQLGDKITPGDYVLQVIVTDKLAKGKYAMATQSMDFEVRQ